MPHGASAAVVIGERHRGVAYPFPLAYFLLDAWNGARHAMFVVMWDQQRKDRGIPSIFG